nr:hypothetical protein RVX_3230 [Nitratidesulfovibrio sp. HK-II]
MRSVLTGRRECSRQKYSVNERNIKLHSFFMKRRARRSTVVNP